MSIGPITPPLLPLAPTAPVAPAATTGASPTAGVDFGAVLERGIDHVTEVQKTADDMAVQAATGQLRDPHDYLIASTQAQLTTELTVAVRNKAVEAFNDIMRMPV